MNGNQMKKVQSGIEFYTEAVEALEKALPVFEQRVGHKYTKAWDKFLPENVYVRFSHAAFGGGDEFEVVYSHIPGMGLGDPYTGKTYEVCAFHDFHHDGRVFTEQDVERLRDGVERARGNLRRLRALSVAHEAFDRQVEAVRAAAKAYNDALDAMGYFEQQLAGFDNKSRIYV